MLDDSNPNLLCDKIIHCPKDGIDSIEMIFFFKFANPISKWQLESLFVRVQSFPLRNQHSGFYSQALAWQLHARLFHSLYQGQSDFILL